MFNERCHDYYVHVWIMQAVLSHLHLPSVFFAHYAQLAAVNTADDRPRGFTQGKEYQRLALARH